MRALSLFLTLSTMFSCGCQMTSLTSPAKLFEEEPDFVTPTKVIPVWSDTVLHQAGKAGQRGCGGRVMFYAGDGKKAVQVDGSLVVYVWDDSSSDKQRKPDRKYVFRAEDFQKHYSASTIGDSYSFWVPWDDTGGEQTELTLVARFIGRDGAEVTSTPGKVILPGEVPLAKKETMQRSQRSETWHREADAEDDGIRQVGFEQASADLREKPRKPSLTTAEIPLTAGFLQRNMQSQPAYSSDELFNSADNNSASKAAELPRAEFNRSQSSHDGYESSATEVTRDATGRANDSSDAANVLALPADRSLQFRHRVQTSRATQRSVDHALSERYQTESRPVPWERD